MCCCSSLLPSVPFAITGKEAMWTFPDHRHPVDVWSLNTVGRLQEQNPHWMKILSRAACEVLQRQLQNLARIGTDLQLKSSLWKIGWLNRPPTGCCWIGKGFCVLVMLGGSQSVGWVDVFSNSRHVCSIRVERQ
ncbi:hypothetical protein CEXT_222621 [Caerostris extrusa]|uniref:Uncharacterized protein n=1 Tax=Caerostris extrusa TaxID=172846 RepID=A0AAV4QCG3_CAEEX|nr:hypothetical protein CEXT_222621 [Caerostris extrusa]